ncbi:MAG: DNA-3-methyladenine glycosylase 2 family protein [Rhodospirillaceae bacterium]|jgi:DNA-3-methyladenine glycosylase II|nr:DNA-3-methyladenine glycosylase 2 family protein [Rhodospirillaceae bacterium]MBT7487593.1 DNA-3-methyladenine glycosylase 2 family protein [Rhodospirillales bacterium]MBT4702111.1 DNA-3-methyladenine glycosylase 2 family protein [Rhodospirillaceae bacterium]MBT5035081.1 DNA-3-methyladenine glycosylase 2 family protein [Rhodospirillaceae bacterium]MBT6222217.1 DNA-3-methyladenine glycosylase 2 family protein [Rhodospirillaceae bacterium]
MAKIEKITSRNLPAKLAQLADLDKDFARAYAVAGVPQIRSRPLGFATLLKVICAQQISTAAAGAIMARLEAAVSPLTAEGLLAGSDTDLRTLGLSRQKIEYGKALARAVSDGKLNFRKIHRMEDEAVIEELTKIKGIGRWSAEIYLLFALRRPDIWPVDDLAVVVAMQRIKGLSERPRRKEMMALAENWRPLRSVAARLCWHYYNTVPSNPE